jgi:hypothetical protein
MTLDFGLVGQAGFEDGLLRMVDWYARMRLDLVAVG